MSTLLSELSNKSAEISKEVYRPVLSANIALSWQDPEDFVKDLNTYAYTLGSRKYDVTDLSGAQKRWVQLEGEIQKEKNKVFAMNITPTGSNANWGHITKPQQLVGSQWEGDTGLPLHKKRMEEKVEEKGEEKEKEQEIKFITKEVPVYEKNSRCKECNYRLLIQSEGKPIPDDFDCSLCDECKYGENIFCKGCSKYFATKGSLKRHHERKKSCKDICEKAVDLSGNTNTIEVPDKPYIVDWVDQMLTKSISNDSDKPYCKHCDVEFANKSNLHKHLSKSVACDKLAKQELIKLLMNKE